MASATPAIDKLLKKLEKEPNSLIFLQLAEEYRKESLYEDALRTCRDGLRRHPNYWSARVAMGRIYHEMGDAEKAREELEKVIKAVPDNLLANKILGDIYRNSARFPEALKRYQLVQMLTPNDQEIVAAIQAIEAQLAPIMPPPRPPQPPPPPPEPPATVEEPAPAAVSGEAPYMEMPTFLEKTEPGVKLVDFDAMDATMPQGASTHEPPAAQPPMEVEEPPVSDAELASLFLESSHATEPAAGPSFPALEEEHFAPFANVSGVSMDLEQREPAPPEPRAEDRTQPMQDREDVAEFEGDELTTQTLAELYVRQGMTDKAVKVYQKLLLNEPENPQIVQRLHELNPADALLSAAASAEQEQAPSPESVAAPVERNVLASVRNLDQQADERKRKITTLENWLAAIRRERE